jgi:hypothetical protein
MHRHMDDHGRNRRRHDLGALRRRRRGRPGAHEHTVKLGMASRCILHEDESVACEQVAARLVDRVHERVDVPLPSPRWVGADRLEDIDQHVISGTQSVLASTTEALVDADHRDVRVVGHDAVAVDRQRVERSNADEAVRAFDGDPEFLAGRSLASRIAADDLGYFSFAAALLRTTLERADRHVELRFDREVPEVALDLAARGWALGYECACARARSIRCAASGVSSRIVFGLTSIIFALPARSTVGGDDVFVCRFTLPVDRVSVRGLAAAAAFCVRALAMLIAPR